MQRTEAATSHAGAPSVPMTEIWRTIRGYILWSYERGTIQYDVMVTLILLFVFLSPLWINYKDKPVERNPHPSGVVVIPDAGGGFVYQVEGSAVPSQDKSALRDQLLRVIEPISGEVTITKVEAVQDKSGHILSYRVWARRE